MGHDDQVDVGRLDAEAAERADQVAGVRAVGVRDVAEPAIDDHRRAAAAQEQAVVGQRDAPELVQRLAERRAALGRVGAREQGVGRQAARPVSDQLDLDARAGGHDRPTVATRRPEALATNVAQTTEPGPGLTGSGAWPAAPSSSSSGRPRSWTSAGGSAGAARRPRRGHRRAVARGRARCASSRRARSPSASGGWPRRAADAAGRAAGRRGRRPGAAAGGVGRRAGPGRRARRPGAADRGRGAPPRVVPQRPRHPAGAARLGHHARRQRERLHRHRRDHVRRQRRPRGAGGGAAARRGCSCC